MPDSQLHDTRILWICQTIYHLKNTVMKQVKSRNLMNVALYEYVCAVSGGSANTAACFQSQHIEFPFTKKTQLLAVLYFHTLLYFATISCLMNGRVFSSVECERLMSISTIKTVQFGRFFVCLFDFGMRLSCSVQLINTD